mmetsp:Transcript_75132/g.208982  ORF Transcript_75132/g.208982 Transcript_75132/m.208982 type:complete len:209 (-) Transcript_75132:3-629(-)
MHALSRKTLCPAKQSSSCQNSRVNPETTSTMFIAQALLNVGHNQVMQTAIGNCKKRTTRNGIMLRCIRRARSFLYRDVDQTWDTKKSNSPTGADKSKSAAVPALVAKILPQLCIKDLHVVPRKHSSLFKVNASSTRSTCTTWLDQRTVPLPSESHPSAVLQDGQAVGVETRLSVELQRLLVLAQDGLRRHAGRSCMVVDGMQSGNSCQ